MNRLKNERKGKLSQITRKRNDIEILKKDRANVEILKEEALFFASLASFMDNLKRLMLSY